MRQMLFSDGKAAGLLWRPCPPPGRDKSTWPLGLPGGTVMVAVIQSSLLCINLTSSAV